jgi:hypothetical protein
MNELDEILLDQYHAAKRTMRVIKTFKILFPESKEVLQAEEDNKLRQKFFENMIENKSLLNKKIKKKRKQKSQDILDKNPIYYVYRNTIMAAVFSYMFFSGSARKYWKQFRKNKNEKT